MKRVIVILLIVIMFAAASACNTSGKKDDPTDPGEDGTTVVQPPVTTPENTPPAVIVPPSPELQLADTISVVVTNNTSAGMNQSPAAGNTSLTHWTWTMTRDRLVENLGSGEYGPMLAVDFKTDDYKTFIFDLRQDAVFHNGDPFTADDVLFTINITKEHPGIPGAEIWSIVESAAALSPFQVEIVLSAVHIDFLYDISSPPAGILNRRAYNEMDAESWMWIGTGPFRVIESDSGSVKMERFDDFWGEQAPTRQVILRHVPEADDNPPLLLSGQIDVCFSVNPADIQQFEDHTNFKVVEAVLNAPNSIGFNMENPLMADRNFRMAIIHAIDREEVAFGVAGIWARAPSEGNNWGYGTEYRLYDIPLRAFDPVLARQYLEASLWNGETVEIAVSGRSNALAAGIVREQLMLNLGLETTINEMDVSVFPSYVRASNAAQIHIFASSFTLSAAESTRNVYYPGMGNNRTRFNNDYISALIDEARQTVDLTPRRAIYHELQRFIADDPPCFNLFWRLNPIVAVNGVDGMRIGYDALQYNLRGIYKIIGTGA